MTKKNLGSNWHPCGFGGLDFFLFILLDWEGLNSTPPKKIDPLKRATRSVL